MTPPVWHLKVLLRGANALPMLWRFRFGGEAETQPVEKMVPSVVSMFEVTWMNRCTRGKPISVYPEFSGAGDYSDNFFRDST